MKKVITQKQTNILSNNFYRGWHNRKTKTPLPMNRITTSYDIGYQEYNIDINLNGIPLIGQTYCLPEEVMDGIRKFCDALHEDAYVNLNIFLADLPSGFNFSHYFGETSRNIKPVIHSTDEEDSVFYPPVLYIYDEPSDYYELTNGINTIHLKSSNSCTLNIATCGPAIEVRWGW